MRTFDLKDGKILVIGDLHLSDYYKGKHKNYLQNCFDVMDSLDKIITVRKPDAIVLLGDLVGWTKPNIVDRERLTKFFKFFVKWGRTAKIFAVKGNHDLNGYPDFMMLSELNLIITSVACDGYFDLYSADNEMVPSARFHIVDYGEEHRQLNIAPQPTGNVVFGHNNFTIAGQTTWYSGGEGIELGHLANFAEVDMVISGHIHNPSPDFCETSMLNGKNCTLFYPGCPTRPVFEKNNMYNSVKLGEISYNKTTELTDFDIIDMPLKPYEEIFDLSGVDLTEKTQDEIDEEMRKAALSDVLGDLLTYRMNQTDPISQIANIPNATEEAKAMAMSYLQTAMDG